MSGDSIFEIPVYFVPVIYFTSLSIKTSSGQREEDFPIVNSKIDLDSVGESLSPIVFYSANLFLGINYYQ